MSSCVFCGIIAGRRPVKMVREWQDAIAFVPIDPVVPDGHILVVPRIHVKDAAESPAITGMVAAYAAEMAAEYGQANLLTAVGRAATQSVFHLHVHVVRREAGDGLMLPWGTTGNPHAPHACTRALRAEERLAELGTAMASLGVLADALNIKPEE